MRKITKFLSLFAFAFVMLISLASCGSSGFYKDYHDAGADIDKDHCFEVVSVSEAKTMITNKESFILFMGSYTFDSCVKTVGTIQSEVDNIDYEGSILYLDITKIVKSTSKMISTAKSLAIKEETLSKTTTTVLMYKDGIIKMDSQDTDRYSDGIKSFSNGSETIAYRAVVDYIAESDVYSRTK